MSESISFNGQMVADIDIKFADIEKAKSEFMGEAWGSIFWKIDNVLDMATDIAMAVYNYPEYWQFDTDSGNGYWIKNPEGFGTWIKSDKGEWVMEVPETGEIVVSYDDID